MQRTHFSFALSIIAAAVAAITPLSLLAASAHPNAAAKAATPVISPDGGTIKCCRNGQYGQAVVITDSTDGATIWYTTDGSTPSATNGQPYSSAFLVSKPETVKAVAVATGHSNSAVAAATFTLGTAAPTPVISPASGPVQNGQSVTVTDSGSGAVIMFTTDGSTPDYNTSTRYCGAGVTTNCSTIVVTSAETVKVAAYVSGDSASAVASASYTVEQAVATPVFSPASSAVKAGTKVRISDATTGAKIYYTTDGITQPSATTGTLYSGPITLTSTSIINAIAVKSGYTNSPIVVGDYAVNAGTFKRLWTFNPHGSKVDAGPSYDAGSLVVDEKGNLYGVTAYGGDTAGLGGGITSAYPGTGAVFEISPDGKGGWTEKVIHSFSDGNSGDAIYPTGALLRDAKGNLYGAASGGLWGVGVVYKLTPPVTSGGEWTETILYAFGPEDSGDGFSPNGNLVMDSSGNIYGTTECGGTGPVVDIYYNPCNTYSGTIGGSGTVFKLSPKTNGSYEDTMKETILHSFTGKNGDGAYPGGLVLNSGKLYGGTAEVENTQGVVEHTGIIYELQNTGKGWSETILYGHSGTVDFIDSEGNIYGGFGAGAYGWGAISELVYSSSTKSYTENVLYSFGAVSELGIGAPGGQGDDCGFVMGSNGVIYGATVEGGAFGKGNVFELAPTKTGWVETPLYNFTGGNDGGSPGYNRITLDASGNIYGMTATGGKYGNGTVFEVTP